MFVIEHWKGVLILIFLLIAGFIFAIYMYLNRLDESDCQEAKEHNTVERWQFYLNDHPNGDCVNDAKEALIAIPKQKEEAAYQTAKEQNTEESWESYIREYPDGDHTNDAKEALTAFQKQKDETACKKAEENNGYGWKNYLKEFPKGVCADKAKTRLEELKQQRGISCTQDKPCKDLKTGLMWSNKSNKKQQWRDAIDDCEKLSQDGYSDWRLPDIDELRTLIQHCHKTQANGSCKVSAKNECLKSDCWYPESSCSCSPDENERYSRLEDVEIFWSSSLRSDGQNFAWYVDFSKGYIDAKNSDTKLDFRCIRGFIDEPQPVEKDNKPSEEETPEKPAAEESDNNDPQPAEAY